MAASTNQTALGVEPTKWVQLLNDATSLFPLQRVIPHPSFFASTNIGSISISVFNLVQSALSDSPGSFHQNAAKHQKLDTNRLKDICVFFRSHWSNSFIHLTFKLNKVNPSLFLRTFYEETCCTLQISGIWGLYVQFLLETNKMLLYLGFDARQSLMKSLTPSFESRDIINILPTSFFSVRTVG